MVQHADLDHAVIPGAAIVQDDGSTVGTASVLNFTNGTATFSNGTATISLTSGGGLTNPMTTPQDIIVGGASGAAGRLAKGTAGSTLAMTNGTVAWAAGTAFPTAATDDRFYRTDLDMEFFYDGTRWLSTEIGQFQLLNTDAVLPWTTTGQVLRAVAPVSVASDIWLVSARAWFFVGVGGSALSASHKWVGTLLASPGGTTLTTFSVDSGSDNTHRATSIATLGTALGTANFSLQVTWAKTGSPAGIFTQAAVTFRYIAT